MDRLERIGREFEVAIYEIGHRLYPKNRRVLDALTNAYAGAGLYTSAFNAASKLVAAHPSEPRFRYNLACALCGLGQLDEALGELTRAVELGFHDFAYMERDADLRKLHSRAEFAALCKRAEQSQRGSKV